MSSNNIKEFKYPEEIRLANTIKIEDSNFSRDQIKLLELEGEIEIRENQKGEIIEFRQTSRTLQLKCYIKDID
ncbi:MAG: hypothetical protein ACFFDB_00345 [Promethearchaeota archaeon]